MLHTELPRPKTLGADLRALRKGRGLTLQDMAEVMGRSVGWLSQVERDLSSPSIGDLRQIAMILHVPVSMLFRHEAAAPGEAGYIVRKGARRPIGAKEAGLVEELLSPDLTDDFEMVHSVFEPFSEIGETVLRPTTEVGVILSGRLDLTIGASQFTLHSQDSFRIRGEPFRWSNPYEQACAAIWVIAPPVY